MSHTFRLLCLLLMAGTVMCGRHTRLIPGVTPPSLPTRQISSGPRFVAPLARRADYLRPLAGEGRVALAAPDRAVSGSVSALHAGGQDGAVPNAMPRRTAAFSAGLSVGLLKTIASEEGALAVPVDDRSDIVAAAESLRRVQKRWSQLSAERPEAAGEAILEAMKSTLEVELDVIVPTGQSMGIDIEGRGVTKVNNKKLGWATGDEFVSINGNEVISQEDIVNAVNKARDDKKPVTAKIIRRSRSPFVTLSKPLRAIYEDTDARVPESDDVMEKVNKLRAKGEALAGGYADPPAVQKKLDAVIADLDAYVAAPLISSGDAKKVTSATGSGGGSGGSDLSGLFN